MGHRICDTIHDYCDPDLEKIHAIIEKLQNMKTDDADADSDGSDEEEEE